MDEGSEGNRKLHFLYLDASGDSGWCPPHGKSATKWYVLLGLALEESVWITTHEKVKALVGKYLPGVPFNARELRYSQLIAGAPPYDKLSGREKKALSDEVFELLIELKPALFAAAIDKTAHKSRYGYYAIAPNVWALQLIAPRFHKYLVRNDARGIFVMDAEERRKDAKLKELIQNAREQGVVLTSTNPLLTNTKLPRIVESVIFVNSDESPAIQLADFASHAIWRHYERKQSDRFNQIRKLFDADLGVEYGLKVWQPT